MYQFLSKNGQTLAFGLGILLTAIFLISAFSGIGEFNMLQEEQQWQTDIFNIGFYAAIALTIVCLIAAVLFGLAQMVGDIKGAIKGIAGIALILVVFFIIYSTVDPSADSAGVMKEVKEFGLEPGQSKFISAAIITTIALSLIALVTFVVFEVINLFK
ncbi:MAG: hypothetical protein AAGI23_17875 [Bacteroidota bacterium]